MTRPLVIRNAEVEGRAGLDVRLEGGRVAAIGKKLPSVPDEIDGRGGALIPGLADHHIHLFALAAQTESVPLQGVGGRAAFEGRLADALAGRRAGVWVRVTGYHETMAGELTLRDLDRIAPRHALRVQHQTGALWMLNSLALARIGAEAGPPNVERDATGRPTGRIWRGDAWLRERIGGDPPALAPVGRRLAALGITAVTDASVSTDCEAAARLGEAVRLGDLPQRLTLMSGGPLAAAPGGAFSVGPVKVLLDDHALPDFDEFVSRIDKARVWGRAVAVHCVTAGELALTLAAFEAAGSAVGDRIEHGGVIPKDAIPRLRALGLTVVTQPAFIRERGDRYLAEVAPDERGDLYRCASLRAAGVRVAASSDAPYASPDPMAAIATAVDRRTAAGRELGHDEAVSPAEALAMYLGPSASPGGPPRRVSVGSAADLCLLDAPLVACLDAPSAERVRATVINGRLVYELP